MFGLMKSCSCSQTNEEKHRRRLHYCGTCKTLGNLYGWKSRALLNNDAVFLGEVLSAISSSDESLGQWDRAYQSYNCFSLPEGQEDMPLALQFSATAVMMIAELKLVDLIMDSSRYLWTLPQRLFSKSFRAASIRLEQWGFPLDDLWRCSHMQGEREAELGVNNTSRSAGEALIYLAEPTAAATGLFFQHGARVVGGSSATQQAMCALGHAFGALVYLLDAFEDYDKDFHTHNFNALRAAYDLSSHKLPAQHRELVIQRLWDMVVEVEQAFGLVPIATTWKAHFLARLKTSLAHKLKGGLPGLSRECRVTAKPRMTFRVRSRAAMSIGKSITRSYLTARSSIFSRLQVPFVFVSALAVAFVFPRQAKAATSYSECVDLPFNLMLLGSLFRPAAVIPHPFSARLGDDQADETVDMEGQDEEPGKEPGNNGCWGCDSCCDCCNCCECCTSCDSCDCCSCCDCS